MRRLVTCLVRAMGPTLFIMGASVLTAKPEEPPIIMTSPETPGAGVTEIVNGKQQDVTKWPATVKFIVQSTFNCTGTIVGDRVLITAAHCLPASGVAVVNVGGSSFNLTCDNDPRFDASVLTYDIALCLTAVPFPHNKFHYESLDLRVTHVKAKTDLFLLGYGCRQFPVDGGPPAPLSGQLYGGISKVYDSSRPPGGHVITKDGVVICPGDSGGSAYLLADAEDVGSARSIVGLNSEYVETRAQSYVTPLSGEADFIKDWHDDHAVTICGLDDLTAVCHPPLFTP